MKNSNIFLKIAVAEIRVFLNNAAGYRRTRDPTYRNGRSLVWVDLR